VAFYRLSTNLGKEHMEAYIGWAVVIIGFVLPLLHVGVTRDMMPRPNTGTCPFSPRAGWIVLVLFLGPIGWLMFLRARRRRKTANAAINS